MSCLAAADGTDLAENYAREVTWRLEVPAPEQAYYSAIISHQLSYRVVTGSQYVMLVDRSPYVQAVMLFWMSPEHTLHFIGASPASTGKPGSFDHFKTPIGVFEHTTANLDFRAEGTKNENGIRGYGLKGMRVFDFGWQISTRGWGKGGVSQMRLQMHATDPDLLEKRLGTIQSKGCIRIPASLDIFLDHHGVLDGDYEKEMAEGKSFWVLPKDREPAPSAGRFLVIIESQRHSRPAWAKPPAKPASTP